MKGLKGRQLVSIPADEQERLEALAARLDDWQDSTRSVCPGCHQTFFHREAATGWHCQTCCQHQRPLRGYMRKSNGEVCPQALCLACGKRGDISRRDLNPVANICLRNNLEGKSAWRRDLDCERCGARGVELQHWAPQAIFNDADAWPTSYLCPTCHRTWHRAMRQARGHSLPPENRYGELPAWWSGEPA